MSYVFFVLLCLYFFGPYLHRRCKYGSVYIEFILLGLLLYMPGRGFLPELALTYSPFLLFIFATTRSLALRERGLVTNSSRSAMTGRLVINSRTASYLLPDSSLKILFDDTIFQDYGSLLRLNVHRVLADQPK